MSLLDFRYWASRYSIIQKDGGGICKFNPWESQELILREVATIEYDNWEAVRRGELADGILIAGHKSRQLGETALARALTIHRVTLNAQQRAIAASVDDPLVLELYNRDKLLLDSLPWWMKPQLRYDEKGSHIHFEGLNSGVLYQTSQQKGGLGIGRQFDLAHFTELSTWENAYKIGLEFIPSIPRSPSLLMFFESTAFGRGNWWHTFVMDAAAGRSRVKLVFIPWYAELTKWRAQPPSDWKPSEVALRHAMKVYETSPKYVGKAVTLPKENLYWWERTREEYQRKGELAYFLTNWCATIEESFQYLSNRAAFPAELLEYLRSQTKPGTPYELRKLASA